MKRLSEIEDNNERTRDTLAYLKSLTEWPPAGALPAENTDAPRYLVPNSGPITATGDPVGPNDPEQQALQDECREKIRSLISTVREGDNELAPLVETARKYCDLIDKDAADIMASALWSVANTLRARHEAHEEAAKQGRVNDELPPLTAAALKDLLATHGIYFLDHPGAAPIERKMREFLNGPRNPQAQQAADAIADTLTDAPNVLAPDAAAPVAEDQTAATGQGASAHMAEVSLRNRLQNVISAVARKIWTLSKTKAGVATDAVIGAEVINWFLGNQSLIAQFYRTVTTQYPLWVDAIVQLIAKLPI